MMVEWNGIHRTNVSELFMIIFYQKNLNEIQWIPLIRITCYKDLPFETNSIENKNEFGFFRLIPPFSINWTLKFSYKQTICLT